MNKFKALEQFQGWPPEWQRLCAEYWIETGEVEPTQVWTTADKIKTVGELVQRGPALPSDQAPYGQRKPAKLAIERPRMRQSKLAWSTAESEFILKLANEVDMPHAVEMFVAKYPARSRDAVRRRVWGIRNGELSSEVKY
jgi:hypothetical protein